MFVKAMNGVKGIWKERFPCPAAFLKSKWKATVPDKNAPIIAYCAGGMRSLLAGQGHERDGLSKCYFDGGRLWRLEERRL